MGASSEARLAFGGMAATPKRASQAEAAVLGRQWNEAAADQAAAALEQDFEPLDDWRASARYRMRCAQNLLRRFAIETCAPRDRDAHCRLIGSPSCKWRAGRDRNVAGIVRHGRSILR